MGRDEESKKKTFLDRLIERNKITTNWNGVLFFGVFGHHT